MGPSRRLVAVLAAVLVLVVACTSSGEPQGYDDVVTEGDEFSIVQTNFLDACELSSEELQFDNVQVVCSCSYDEIRATVPYEVFKELDSQLVDDITTEFPAEIREIIADCIRSSAA